MSISKLFSLGFVASAALAGSAPAFAETLTVQGTVVPYCNVNLSNGRYRPWPWTLNQGGDSHYLDSAAEALAKLDDILATGTTNVDVGCMQLNWKWHSEAFASRAYEDTALPIGFNQTISQPYIVGLMTQALDVQPRHRVLEIGTGSGYQTAVLAQLVERVFSVERIQALQDRAKERLAELKLRNVVFRWGDGRTWLSLGANSF